MTERVETPSGTVEGRLEGDVRVFRGIPFAKAPVGALRFAAPEPCAPWSGALDATGFASSAPQSPMMLPLPGMDVGATGEDCLALNVFAPAEPSATPRPVMVWIHGGGFVIGSGSQVIYDGAPLAARGDVVVVTINYRLGALGFLDLVGLCEGAIRNAGMRDQVAALEWVRANIEAFGGDTENVTIFGESAGGMSVGTLLGMPSARGLFQKAIPQSGACHNFHTREAGRRVALALLEALGLAEGEAAKLRDLPYEKLIAAQAQVQLGLAQTVGLLPFQPVLDEETLPDPALAAVRRGHAKGVAILAGSTRDEWKLFSMLDPGLQGLDEAKLLARLGDDVPEVGADELHGVYHAARSGRGDAADPATLFAAVQTDRVFRIPAVRLAEAQHEHDAPVYMYRVDWESPMLGGALGACHGVELPFVFGTHGAPGGADFVGAGPEVEALSGRMMDAWTGFARDGDPGWARYDVADRTTRIFAGEDRTETDPHPAERTVWHTRL